MNLVPRVSLLLCFVLLVLPLVFAFNFTVTSPSEGGTYDGNDFIISLTSDAVSDFFYIKEISGLSKSWVKLCDDVKECVFDELVLREGTNTLSFKAVDTTGTINIITRMFVIDSRKPVITKVYPSGSKSFFTNGTLFSVEYIELNLTDITLHYGRDDSFLYVSLFNCKSSKLGGRQNCTTNLSKSNLSPFDGEDIIYWFSVNDKIHSVNSTKKVVSVDTSSPVIQNFTFGTVSNKVIERKMKFIFEITEENFAEIVYRDSTDLRPVWKKLCTSLIQGRCVSVKSFMKGEHRLSILVRDKAGNSNSIQADFTIF